MRNKARSFSDKNQRDCILGLIEALEEIGEFQETEDTKNDKSTSDNSSLWELAQWVISPPIKAGLEIYKWSKRKNPEPPTE